MLMNPSLKRKRTLEIETECKRRKLSDLFSKISKTKSISPLQLLKLSQSPANGVVKGLARLESVMKPGMKEKFSRVCKQACTYSKKSKAYQERRRVVQLALKDWESRLNKINTDPAPIFVENEVDLEGPPDNFEYINDYKEGNGVEIPQDPLIGCECEDCYDEKKHCCPANSGAEYAYNIWGRVKVPPGTPIYECNKRCRCGQDCKNRVVQHGRKFKVAIFRTKNGRGWGVKTLQKIKKGSFVIEYVGEVGISTFQMYITVGMIFHWVKNSVKSFTKS